MALFATRRHSQSERRRTRRLRNVLGLAAAGCVVPALLATPALADSSPAVDNTAAAAVDVVDSTVQSTSGGNVTPPATPTPPQDAAPAPAPPEPSPAAPEPSPAADASQVAPPEHDVPTTSNGSGSEPEVTNGATDSASKTISGAADTVKNALPESVGKTASDLTETVGKATGGSLDLSGLPKLTIAPILPASPIPDLPGILGTADDLLGLNLRSTVSLVTTPVADLLGDSELTSPLSEILGASELTAPLSEILGVAGKGEPPGAPPAHSSPGGHGGSLDQPLGSHALTGPTSLSATHEALALPVPKTSSRFPALPRSHRRCPRPRPRRLSPLLRGTLPTMARFQGLGPHRRRSVQHQADFY
jgi:hypothetical protein